MINPFEKFNDWFKTETLLESKNITQECCLSTIGIDGFPNARFVSLKETRHNTFIITGPYFSRKFIELESNPNVSLTFWWKNSQRQIRIQGKASKISEKLADRYFDERSIEVKIVSNISIQGREVEDLTLLQRDYKNALLQKNQINRPFN